MLRADTFRWFPPDNTNVFYFLSYQILILLQSRFDYGGFYGFDYVAFYGCKELAAGIKLVTGGNL